MDQYKEVGIIIQQIIILALLGITGFIAGKKKILPENSHKIISALILKITTPLLIFTTMGNYSFTSETLKNGLSIFGFGVFFILLGGFVALGPCKLMNITDKKRNIYVTQSMFGNVIFMAYPLLRAMYGDVGIVYAIFYNIANDAILWTLGVYLFNKHKTQHWKDNLSHLINPNTIAFMSGIIMIFIKSEFHIEKSAAYGKVWDIFYTTFNGLGHTTIYLSMIFIGLILANVKLKGLKELVSRFSYFFVYSGFKLLIIPLLALLFFRIAGGGFDVFVKRIVVLQLGMPAATIVSALALQYDSDYDTATDAVFISTILSMFTLPFIAFLLN